MGEVDMVVEMIRQGLESALRPLTIKTVKNKKGTVKGHYGERNINILEDREFMESESLKAYCNAIGACHLPILEEYRERMGSVKDAT